MAPFKSSLDVIPFAADTIKSPPIASVYAPFARRKPLVPAFVLITEKLPFTVVSAPTMLTVVD